MVTGDSTSEIRQDLQRILGVPATSEIRQDLRRIFSTNLENVTRQFRRKLGFRKPTEFTQFQLLHVLKHLCIQLECALHSGNLKQSGRQITSFISGVGKKSEFFSAHLKIYF